MSFILRTACSEKHPLPLHIYNNLKLSTLSNSFVFLITECKAGYFLYGSECVMCTGNTIKTEAGNATDCDTDAACDGVMTVPNRDHTHCG